MKDQQVSHYRLTEKLGAGTYGEVWKGVHVDRAQFTVAVKLIAPQVREDPSFLRALEQECVALDRMDHPSIVRFRELVVRDNTVAMVLELLEGADLEALLAAGPQPVDEVVRILERVLDGLAYAHSEGVIHRDIKPGNIFRCTNGRVKLMDFGIARAADGTQATQTGTLKGTLDYMAPERFANQTTPAADVYAVGLVAWELLAGRRAAPEGDLAAKVGWHMGVGLSDVRTVRTDCPSWLAEVVAALGAKDAGARPTDGAAALALLQSRREAVATGPGPATPPPVKPGTVTLSASDVAAALPPTGPGSGPGTAAPTSTGGPTSPPTAPQTVAVPTASLPPASPAPATAPTPPPAVAATPKAAPAVAPARATPGTDPSPPDKKQGGGFGAIAVVAAVLGTGLILVGVLAAIAIPNYLEMQNRAKRAEIPSNIKGIKTAELAYDAAFDKFVVENSFQPDSAPGKELRRWRTDSRFDMLSWAPDGKVRGSYKVVTTNGGRDFRVTGISDIDGDGSQATYTATKTLNTTMNTPLDTF